MGTPSRNIRLVPLDAEHKLLIDIGKTLFGTFYLLAPMSFVLNGTLLGAISWVVLNKVSLHPTFAKGVVLFACAIGTIYNLGALLSAMNSIWVANNLNRRISVLDQELGFHIAEMRNCVNRFIGIVVVSLTIVFFSLWILGWIFLAVATANGFIFRVESATAIDPHWAASVLYVVALG
jgi:hypothetical protein